MKFFIIFLISFLSLICKSQISIVPELSNVFAGIERVKYNGQFEKNFKKHKFYGGIQLGLGVTYQKNNKEFSIYIKGKESGHKIQVFNNFATPNEDSIHLDNFSTKTGAEYIDISLNYAKLYKTGNKKILGLRYKPKLGFGVGILLNNTYDDYYYYGRANTRTFYFHETFPKRLKEVGYNIKFIPGVNFYNRNSKKIIDLRLNFDLGLKTMSEQKINYTYGYFSYPDRVKEVKDIVYKIRGTTYGVSIGFPIGGRKATL